MPQLEVQIMGQSYLLGCQDGGEAALKAAVQRVDNAMCKIRDAGKIKARERIAVLAALNLAAAEMATETTPGSVDSAPIDAASQTRLATIAAQIDAALSADGQLI